jgi:glycolate dehydrogenase FAD-binding subunit
VSVDLDVVRKDLLAVCPECYESDAPGTTDEAGAVPAFGARPGSTEQAAAVMRMAAEHELAVVPRGRGSRLSWGIPAARCDLTVDMSRMAAVVEHSHGDLVARVQAGALMKDVQATLAQAGQEIALDVPGDATVGGVIGSALAGPRRLRYGTPRDLLIGITIVRADGTIAKSGGKVVKNVAGYDLGKLFAGSAGTLGLITEAMSVACDAVAAAANSPLVASAVELARAEPGGPIRVGVLIEGSAQGVAARSARVRDLLGTGAVAAEPPRWWPSSPDARSGETLVQVSFWVSALGRVLDALDAAAAAAGVAPVTAGSAGAGVLHVRLGAEAEAGAAAGFVAALRASLAAERGEVTVLAAPASVREALAERGGMYPALPALALMRSVKNQFDPGHRLAPGRFPDGA